MRVLVLFIALLASGCSPVIVDGRIRCADSSHACPDGFRCWELDFRCHRGPPPDAGPDAMTPPPVDGGTPPYSVGNPCTTMGDCVPGDTCIRGSCVHLCTMGPSDADCPGTERECIPAPPPIGITAACLTHCPAGTCPMHFYCDTMATPATCFPMSWRP